MPLGLEPMLVGGGIVLLSLLFSSWANHEVPPDRSSYDWAWVQGQRWPGMFAKYVGIPLGVALIVFGAVVLIGSAVLD